MKTFSHSRRRRLTGKLNDLIKEDRDRYFKEIQDHERSQGSVSKDPESKGPEQAGYKQAVVVEQAGAGEFHDDSGSLDVSAPEGKNTEAVEVSHGEVDKQSHKAPRRPKAKPEGKEGQEDTGVKAKGGSQKGRPHRKTSAPSDNA